MTNLEPGNPHYFFLAAMVFPRRPLEYISEYPWKEREPEWKVEVDREDGKEETKHTWYRCADLEPSIPSDASNLGET
jgi:hypothetical protein